MEPCASGARSGSAHVKAALELDDVREKALKRFGPLLALALCALPVMATAQERVTRGKPVSGAMPLGTRAGNPTYNLPSGYRLISPFGERPVFSPDGRKIAFIGKSYGDAFEYDLATGAIRNLTGHMAHEGFLRVHYLADGSFLLLGPHISATTREATRLSTIELFWLDPAAIRPPVPLGKTIFEGIATSPTSNRIAWTETQGTARSFAEVKGTALKLGTVIVANGSARIEQERTVTTFTDCFAEAQDFLPGEKGLTLPCYLVNPGPGQTMAQVLSVDFASGKVTRYPTPLNLYGEVEGIFPDGKRTLVECSGDRAAGMDLCVLDLNPNKPVYTRMTHIMDYGRWKFGNPVVRRDGRMIAAQVGSADVIDAGVGQGIVVIDLPADF